MPGHLDVDHVCVQRLQKKQQLIRLPIECHAPGCHSPCHIFNSKLVSLKEQQIAFFNNASNRSKTSIGKGQGAETEV